MENKSEVLERGCTGCEGLLYDIDNLKLLCEMYQREVIWARGEQIKI